MHFDQGAERLHHGKRRIAGTKALPGIILMACPISDVREMPAAAPMHRWGFIQVGDPTARHSSHLAMRDENRNTFESSFHDQGHLLGCHSDRHVGGDRGWPPRVLPPPQLVPLYCPHV